MGIRMRGDPEILKHSFVKNCKCGERFWFRNIKIARIKPEKEGDMKLDVEIEVVCFACGTTCKFLVDTDLMYGLCYDADFTAMLNIQGGES